MLLPKNGVLLKCIQPHCHNNGIFLTTVAMIMGYTIRRETLVAECKTHIGGIKFGESSHPQIENYIQQNCSVIFKRNR